MNVQVVHVKIFSQVLHALLNVAHRHVPYKTTVLLDFISTEQIVANVLILVKPVLEAAITAVIVVKMVTTLILMHVKVVQAIAKLVVLHLPIATHA